MSIKPVDQFPGKVAPATPDNPFGTARNITIPGDGTGTPWESSILKDEWGFQHAMLLNAGMEPNGTPDSAENSQLFKAAKASIGNGANLLSNHNFLIASPDDSQPPPDATPRSYPPGFQIFSGVFANESTGITNLTYIDGRVSFSGGDFYMAVPNAGALENITEFVASVADFDGKPRTRGVSYALVGDEYRVTVGVDALEDVAANPTALGSVKFEQGSVATGHEVGSLSALNLTDYTDLIFDSVSSMSGFNSPSIGDIYKTKSHYQGWAAISSPPFGGAFYIVRDSADLPTADGVVNHYVGGNSFIAQLLTNGDGTINIDQCGARPNEPSLDSSSFINAAIASFGSVTASSASYFVNDAVILSKTGTFKCAGKGSTTFNLGSNINAGFRDNLNLDDPHLNSYIGHFQIFGGRVENRRSLDLTYFTVNSTFEHIRIYGAWAGIRVRKGWSSNCNNIYIRNDKSTLPLGPGLELVTDGNSEQVNAIDINGFNIQGFENNVKLSSGASSAVSRSINFNGGAIEGSRRTAVINETTRPVSFNGVYFENNFQDLDPSESEPIDYLSSQVASNASANQAFYSCYFRHGLAYIDNGQRTSIAYNGYLTAIGCEFSSVPGGLIDNTVVNNGNIEPHFKQIHLDGFPNNFYKGVTKEITLVEYTASLQDTADIANIAFKWPDSNERFGIGATSSPKIFIELTPISTFTATREASFRFNPLENTSVGNQILTGTNFTLGQPVVFEIIKSSANDQNSNQTYKGFMSQTSQGSSLFNIRIFARKYETRDF